MEELKLNIGCGPTGQIDGYQNLDNSPSVILSKIPSLKFILYHLGIISLDQYKADWSRVKYCDAGKGLPYRDESINKIYSSHFLEHIPQEKGIHFLSECFRVLKKPGIMRLVIPDLHWHAVQYVEETNRLQRSSDLPDDRTVHDVFLNQVCGAYLGKTRYGSQHCYMYDFPTVVCILKSIGFRNIRKCEYGKGTDEELASHDSRPLDSLHIEAGK